MTRWLTVADVAKKHGVPLYVAAYWFRIDNFLPGVVWGPDKWGESRVQVVPERHAVIDPNDVPWWEYKEYKRPPTGRPRGRPPGAKNKRPYPKGVKRPRKAKEQQEESAV